MVVIEVVVIYVVIGICLYGVFIDIFFVYKMGKLSVCIFIIFLFEISIF